LEVILGPAAKYDFAVKRAKPLTIIKSKGIFELFTMPAVHQIE
jgi:hypothetical protein